MKRFAALLLLLMITPALVEAQRMRTIPTSRQVLEQALDAWNNIQDYETILRHYETRDQRHSTYFIHLRIVQESASRTERRGTLRMDVYNEPIPMNPSELDALDASPIAIYLITPDFKFRHYEASTNTLTVQWIRENDPLPQFLQLAGFLAVDLDELSKQVNLDRDVQIGMVSDRESYRIQFSPRAEYSAVTPNRFVWVDRETFMPIRFIQDGEDMYLVISIEQSLINNGLDAATLMPRIPDDIPRDVAVNDLTR